MHARKFFRFFFSICVLIGFSELPSYVLAATPSTGSSAVVLVQQAETAVGAGSATISQAFPGTSTAGDLIILTAKWGDQTISVSSVADSAGNTYISAVGPTAWSGTAKQAQTFYAKNIIASSKPLIITVTLSGNSSSSFHLYQFEYANADPNAPLDVTSAATGTGTALNSGAVTTTATKELLYAVGFEDTGTSAAGSGFTAESTFHGNIVEDRNVSSVGTYEATAADNVSSNWFMQLATFRATGSGTQGAAVTLSTTSLGFGNQAVGSASSPQSVTLTNSGSGPLTISSIASTGDYSQTNNCGSSVAAGANCAIQVTFRPTATGTRSGTVAITDNASNSPQQIGLTGNGTSGSTTAPAATLSPTSLNFGNQTVGSASSPQSVTLTNSGNEPLAISSIASTGDYSQTNDCGSSVAASANCTIQVTFQPTATGTRSGTVSITDNAANSPQQIGLTGNGTSGGAAVAPAVTLSTTSLNFGNQAVGTASAPQSVTLTNSGNGPLTISSIASTGDYSQTNNCGSSVAAGANCAIQVTFRPTATGTRSGTVAITDNASNSPQQIGLTGNGTSGGTTAPAATLSPTSLNFGNQTVGTTSSPQSVTLTNSGGAPLTISGIVAAGDYSQTNNCGSSVAAGANCAIQVTFHPTATGTRTGTVSITDNASNSPQQITMTGNGISTSGGTGPLKVAANNPHLFVNASGQAVYLAGSHTWDNAQDIATNSPPSTFDFNGFVDFLKAHKQNVTVLWHKDLPTACNWNSGTWHVSPWPWLRSGTGTAADGLPKFDLSQLDQSYFDRLRGRVVQLQQSGIYAIVQLFDGLGLTNQRCSSDGYPFSAANNVNGIDDGYAGGSSGTNSMNMNYSNIGAILKIQEAYVAKMVDTLHDLDNVLWEISEESPTAAGANPSPSSSWNETIISYIHNYEASRYPGQQHPVGYPTAQYPGNDSDLYASSADWIAPTLTGGNPIPIAPTNNPGKVIINDSDHSYYYPNFVNSSTGAVNNEAFRNYVWENFANGAMLLFMDPYEIYWPSNQRNLCPGTSNGVCTGPDRKYDPARDNLGYVVSYASKMNLLAMTPQPGLSSTNYCLANASATGEYLIYDPTGGSFTVNLSGTSATLTVEWFNPATGTTSSGGTVPSGTTTSFSPPSSGDAVLYLKAQ